VRSATSPHAYMVPHAQHNNTCRRAATRECRGRKRPSGGRDSWRRWRRRSPTVVCVECVLVGWPAAHWQLEHTQNTRICATSSKSTHEDGVGARGGRGAAREEEECGECREAAAARAVRSSNAAGHLKRQMDLDSVCRGRPRYVRAKRHGCFVEVLRGREEGRVRTPRQKPLLLLASCTSL
jgi:hypothetical protein